MSTNVCVCALFSYLPCQSSQWLCIAVVHLNGMQGHYIGGGGAVIKGLSVGECVVTKGCAGVITKVWGVVTH